MSRKSVHWTISRSTVGPPSIDLNRMVFAFGLVVFAFAFSTPLKLSTRVILLALSPITALVCNVVRLVPTSLIYGYGSVGRAEWFHDLTGWVRS